VVLINRGELLYDGALSDLTNRVQHDKLIEVWLPPGAALPAGIDATRRDGRCELSVPRDQVPAVVSRLLAEAEVLDLSVKDAPLDVLMDQIYRQTQMEPS
jgi:ABC-type uncharacterized transport system ATPase subunit